MSQDKSHKRINDHLFGPLERPALHWLAAHQPAWMNPDILTFIGILGGLIIFAGYVLSRVSPAFLWLASFGFFVNWYGDSLDGTLARYRKIERPKYGFFVDHNVDVFSQLWIFTGLGLSPYITFSLSMLALVGYLMVSVLVYVNTFVTGTFKISYGRFGPTEVRVVAIVANLIFLIFGVRPIQVEVGTFSVYDVLVIFIAFVLFAIFTITTTTRAIELSKLDERGNH